MDGAFQKTDLTSISVAGLTLTGASSNHSITDSNVYGGTEFTSWNWTVSNPFGADGTTEAVTLNLSGNGSATIPPDLDINVYPSDVQSSDTTFTLDALNTGSTTDYKVRTGSYTGTVVGSWTGVGSDELISHQPSTVSPGTQYFVTGSVSVANGGDGVEGNSVNFYVLRPEPGSGGGTNPSATYGVQIFNSSAQLTLDMSDSAAFFKASGTATASGTGTIDISVPGVTTSDFAFTTTTSVGSYTSLGYYSLRASIPSNGTVRLHTEQRAAGSSKTFGYAVISFGD